MRQFGLVGRNISYSFSKGYFAEKFQNKNIVDAVYDVFDLKEIQEIEQILYNPNLVGFNITIPYKQQIIPYLDLLSPEANKIGAVNTVYIKDGQKIGYNTDCFGFENSFTPLLKTYHKKALILGNGGAAKAIIYVLENLGIPFQIVSRTKVSGHITYHDLNQEIIQDHQIIINCTPLGTYPDISNSPLIPYQYLTPQHLLYDLIYNPEITQFLQNGLEKGATIKNGYEMLVLQAEKSWEIWNNLL